MKKSLLLLLMSVCSPSFIFAAVGDTFTKTVEGIGWTFMVLTEEGTTGTCMIYKSQGEGRGFTLPENWNGVMRIPGSVVNGTVTYTVTEIGEFVNFYDLSELKELYIPQSITKICCNPPYNAFRNCPGLEKIEVEDGNECFYSKGSNAIIYYHEYMNDVLMTGCKNTTIPDNLKIIGNAAFVGCSSLTSISVPSCVTEIQYEAFAGCTGLTEIVLPDALRDLGGSAFKDCSSLQTVTIPKNVGTIEENAFDGCNALTTVYSKITNPSAVNLSESAFPAEAGKYKASLKVPVGTLEAYQQADVWKDFTSISEDESIGELVDGDQFSLTDNGVKLNFTILDANNKTCSIEKTRSDGGADYAYSVVDETNWDKTLVIPESITIGGKQYTVTTLGHYSLWDFKGLQEVTIPSSIVSMENNPFQGCSDLETIIIQGESFSSGDRHDHIAHVNEYSENVLITGCKNTVIPDNIDEIGSEAFYKLATLTSIKIPANIKKIGYAAFANNQALTSVTSLISDPSSVIVGMSAFYQESGKIQKLYVPFGTKAAYTTAGWNTYFTEIEELPLFIAKTTEGIDVVYTILDETAKTCCVGYTDGSSEETAVTNRSSLTGTLTIPSTVTPPGSSYSYTVKEIGKYAFYGCSTLESIEIPSSIEVIDDYAFADCGELGSITLPAQLTTIGDKAFMDCKTIESINIPASVNSIGKGILSGCIGLSSITVTNGNTRYYSGLDNNVIICEAYTVIAGCKNTVIPSSITKIDDYAFENLEDLTIVIPNDITEIGVRSFAGLSNSVVTLPTTTVTIGDHAFADGENSMIISSYQTPITTVHADAFINSSSPSTPKKLQVPAGTKDAYLAATGWSVFGSGNIIEEQAGVKTINVAQAGTLPDLISAAEKYSITELKLTGNLNGTDFRLIREMAGNDYQGNPTGGKLKILDISEANIVEGGEKYIDTDKVTSTTGTITLRGGDFFHFGTQNNVLGNSLFAGCDKLEKVILPESLTSIGEYVFWYCLNLKSFEVPTNVTSIGEDFIFGPHKITEISVKDENTVFSMVGNKKGLMLGTKLLLGCSDTEIPASTTIIGANAFAYCEGLTTVTLPASVTTIERDAFLSSGLTSITLSSALTTIGSSAFSGCSGLTSLTIPKSVTSFSPIALMNCSGLTELIVEDGNTVYDSRDNCNAIIEKTTNKLICGSVVTVIPTTVNVIGADAFRESLQLSSFTIPDWVTTIGERAFMTSGLETITIPSSVTSIGENAFTGCNRMTTVTAEATTPPSINNSFNSYERLTLYVPTGCIGAYQAKDGWKDFNKIEEIPTSTVLTARSFSRKYGKEDPVFDYIVEGRAITGTPEITCAATKSSDVGTYDIVISKGSVTNSNVTYVNGTLTIEKAIGDMSAPSGKGEIFYSGTAQELVNPGHTSTGTMEYSLDGTNYGTTIPKGTDAKDYMIYYRVKGDKNHEDVAAQSFKVTIRKAPLKITANSYTRKQGEKNPEFGLTYDGFKNNETEAVLTKKPTISCIATENSEPSTYEILVSGASAANYDISYVKGTLTVEVAPQKPKPDPKGTVFAEDVGESSSKENTVAFVVRDGEGSDTPTVAIADDNDLSGSIKIPETVTHNGVEYKVTEIGEGAFQNNTSLTEVKIPASITSIGANAFAGCKNLQEITINIIVPINLAVVGARGFTRATGDDVFEGVNKETCILYVPEGSVEQYKSAPVWKEFKNILPIKSSTGIQGVEKADGEPFDVFNLSGQKVKSKATSLDGLPRGIYIIKGKKVMK